MGIPSKGKGFGWLRDLPNPADRTIKSKVIADLHGNKKINLAKRLSAKTVPCDSADLRPWCTTIDDQDYLGSCSANAGVGLFEYMEVAGYGKWTEESRLFLYKATRDLLGWTGDTGAFPRTTMEAMVLFGIPPEDYWPYDEASFDIEPPAFCYSFAENYKAIKYYRLDYNGIDPKDLLMTIKIFLCAYLPSMFGFSCFPSIYESKTNGGKIPYPAPWESVFDGHVVVAVGFDDSIEITNNLSGDTTTGALLIRNSWGESWGMNGYGWFPYDYVLNGLAADFWTILSESYVDTGQFGFD